MSREPSPIMKPFTRAVILLASAAATLSLPAQVPVAPNAVQSLRVLEGTLPVFPYELIQLGVREGLVRVAFSVDPEGRVEDCLAVMYTQPQFARASVAAVRHWRFAPSRYQGQPIGATSELTFDFQVQGTVVVSLNVSEVIAARLFAMTDGHQVYEPCSLRELDRIPIPIATPSPIYPAQLAAADATRHVTVNFYIDEKGNVRLPNVDANADPRLGAVAIDAMRNWKFEPPTCKGRPVLVHATQQFNFHSQKQHVAVGAAR